MNASQILEELKPLGKDSYKRTLMKNHGVKEPCYGVAISELQKIRKRIKKDYQLAKDLYDTGNYDAMYLAGLIADDAHMTQEDLQHWVEQAYGGGLHGTTVPSVAAGSPHGDAMALRWIESNAPLIAAAGWATLSAIVSITPDAQLDLDEFRSLLKRVEKEIHQARDLPRYQMNQFVISVGSFVAPLKDTALRHAEAIGPVTADLGNNQCQVFSAPEYIRKVEARGATGKKRKGAKC